LGICQSKKGRREAWKAKKATKFDIKKIEKEAVEINYYIIIKDLPNGEGLSIYKVSHDFALR